MTTSNTPIIWDALNPEEQERRNTAIRQLGMILIAASLQTAQTVLAVDMSLLQQIFVAEQLTARATIVTAFMRAHYGSLTPTCRDGERHDHRGPDVPPV